MVWFSNSYQLQQCCWHPQLVEHCSWPVWHICMCGFSETMVIPLSMEHQSPLDLNFWGLACHSQPNLDLCMPCRYKQQKVGAHTESALPSWCLNSSMLSPFPRPHDVNESSILSPVAWWCQAIWSMGANYASTRMEWSELHILMIENVTQKPEPVPRAFRWSAIS